MTILNLNCKLEFNDIIPHHDDQINDLRASYRFFFLF